MQKILVTGATGLLGSELIRQLLAGGADVRILARQSSSLSSLEEGAREAIEVFTGDITDASAVDAAVRGRTHVFHAAGYIGFGGRRDRERLRAINVDGTANTVNACLAHGVKRIVHTSSMAAFGRPESGEDIIDEQTAWTASKQNSEYALSKYLAELEIYRGIAEGLDAVIVNPALIFGVGRPGENTRRIAEKVRDGRLPGIPSGGTNVVDARDVAEGHRLAMKHGRSGERYFLGGENLPWAQIIADLAAAFGTAPPPLVVPPVLASAMATVSESFARLTGRTPQLTRETARNASRFYRYSNRKAVDELGCRFRPFEETASHLASELSR